MKNIYHFLLIALFLSIYSNAEAQFYYTIKGTGWDNNSNEAYKDFSATYTYYLENGQTGSIYLTYSLTSGSFTTNSRINRIDRKVTYKRFGVPVEDNYSMTWGIDKLSLRPGIVPLDPEIYYTTNPQIHAFDGDTEIPLGSIIDFGKTIKIKVTRNGYMGKLPIYYGTSTSLSNNVLFIIPENVDSYDVDLSQFWDQLAILFGGNNLVVNQNVFLGFKYTSEHNGITAKTNVLNYRLSANLNTQPLKATRLCTSDTVKLIPVFLNPPYTIYYKQGTSAYKSITVTTDSIKVAFNTINTPGNSSNNFEVYVCHTGVADERTKKIQLVYLSRPPNIIHHSVTPENVSCEGKNDGYYTVSLPDESPDSSFYYHIHGPTNYDMVGSRSIKLNNLTAGNYSITVEYKYPNPADYGCYASLLTPVIGVKPKLTITASEVVQSCSYNNDASIVISKSNGVGAVTYTVNGITYNENIIKNLPPGKLFTIQAFDAAICSSNVEVKTTTKLKDFTVSVSNSNQIKCYGDYRKENITLDGNQGSALLYLNGGSAVLPGFYNFQGNLHVPKYSVIAIDAKGCRDTLITSFHEPPKLKFLNPAFTISDTNGYGLVCNNDYSGRIALHKTGGTGTTQFSIVKNNSLTGPSTDSVFTGLSAGIYSAYLRDENNCLSDTIKNITITEPAGIEFENPVITSETCRGTGDAAIGITVKGFPEKYQWFRNDMAMDGKTSRNLAGTDSGVFKLNVAYNHESCNVFSPPYVIEAKKPLNFVFSTHESCADGLGGGEIRINGISNGKAQYSYVLNNGSQNLVGPLPLVLNNLQPATHTLEIRDANYIKGGIFSDKCKVSKSIVIAKKSLALITPGYSQPLCHGDLNGKITATVIGPDEPVLTAWYNHSHDSIGTGNILQSIPAGTYHAKIIDNRNCVIEQQGLTLEEPLKLKFTTITTEKAACTPVSDGKISINLPSGGVSAYQYSKDAGNSWQSNPAFTGLHEGNFHIFIKDAHNCKADTSITVTSFKPVITLGGFDSVSCSGSTDAIISAAASGSKTHGTGYTYHLLKLPSGTSLNNTGIFRNLNKGKYLLYAGDSQGCLTDTLLKDISEPPLLTATLQLVDSASCNQNTGKIAYEIHGGNGGYNLLWKNSAIGEVTELNLSTLKAGTYQLNIRDRKSCTAQTSIIVPDRPFPVINKIQILKQSWCNKPLGSAKAFVSSGSKPYMYLWDDNHNTQTDVVSNLPRGTYHISVTDRYQCKATSMVTLVDGPEISLTPVTHDPHCGQNDGSVQLNTTGGIKPYLYHWADSVSSAPVENPFMDHLYSGRYDISISDSVGCLKPFTIVLNDLSGPRILSSSTTKSWCGLSKGTAKVLATGGILPYNYTWSPAGTDRVIGTGQSVSLLKAGIYTVKITDGESCKVYKNIEVTDSAELQPKLLAVQIDSSACGKLLGRLKGKMTGGLSPYSYKWNTGNTSDSLVNVIAGTYCLRATDQRGCKDSLEMNLADRKNPVIYMVSKESAYCGKASGSLVVGTSLGKAPFQAYLTSKPDSKIPLSYNTSLGIYTARLDNLLPLVSPYIIRVSDMDGCESGDIGVLINDNNPLTIVLNNISAVSCNGLSDGSAEVLVSDGYEPYNYEWSSNSVDSNINNTLPAGPFTVKITDAKGCTKTYYSTAPITQPEPLAVSDIFITRPSCYNICDASISATASGGNGSYVYVWNNTDTSFTASHVCPGDIQLEVSDARNCRLLDTMQILNPPPMSGTNLPDSAKVCSGQHFFANPGDNWNNVTWTFEDTLYYSGNIADIAYPGTYIMDGFSVSGCQVKDTLTVIMTNDLLNANFLMMSEAYAGDTVVIIEISWPVAEKCTWDFPKQASVLYEQDWYREVVFEEAGNYYFQLTASLAGCTSVVGKYIAILETVAPEPESDIPEPEKLIKSFMIYPNPAKVDLNVDVQLAKENDVRMEIYSLSGGVLTRILNNYGQKSYLMNVNVEDLLPGTYILKLIAGNETKTKMLIIQ